MLDNNSDLVEVGDTRLSKESNSHTSAAVPLGVVVPINKHLIYTTRLSYSTVVCTLFWLTQNIRYKLQEISNEYSVA